MPRPRETSLLAGQGRRLCFGLLLAIAAVVLGGCGRQRSARQQPNGGGVAPRYNVVLIVSDALRADHLGCYGYQRDTSPNIDRLAASATLFTQAVSQSSRTGASHAAMLTSRYPTDLGLFTNSGTLPASEQTLAEILRNAGYDTAAFVSNLVLHKDRLRGIARGFKVYDFQYSSYERNRGLPFRRARDTGAAAQKWLRGAREPFFLWVHFIEPHGPYQPSDARQVRKFESDALAAEQRTQLPTLKRDVGCDGIPGYQALPGLREVGSYVARYDACIRDMDRGVSELLATLKRKGAADRTLIAFTADHGEALGEHGYYFQHGHDLTEDLLHVPLILWLPGSGAARKVSSVVQAVDLMPTFLEAVGLRERIPAGARGIPLLGPAVEAGGTRDVVSAVWKGSVTPPLVSLRRDGWKLIASQRRGECRLFYLPNDPGELKDLAAEQRAQADALYAAAAPYLSQAQPSIRPRTDARTREALRSLGYLE